MVHGVRAGVSLTSGLVLGVLLSVLLFLPDELIPRGTLDGELSSEHWEVIIKKAAIATTSGQSHTRKVVRAGFAATELGIREKLVVILLGQSSLMVALNTSIGRHVPHLQLFADISRIDGDIAILPNLAPYRLNGQHSHIPVLNLIFNMTIHEKFDWYYMIPDTTYVNPFELMRFVNHVNWNRHVAIGFGTGDDSKRCSLQAGILLTNLAMQSLVQHRHLCSSISSSSDHNAFELCIHLATNLSCTSYYQSWTYHWWKFDEGLTEGGGSTAIHDTVEWWASSSQDFNQSLSVSPLHSDIDAHTLHQHFLNVELNRIEFEIDRLSAEIVSLSYDITDGPSQPAGLPPYSKPPDRYQVPKWHFFTSTEIFKNEPNQNVYALSGDDKLDVDEIVAAARKFVKESGEGSDEEFLQLRNGYRLFDPVRGMDYIVDLLYRDNGGDKVHRIHLTRVISNNQLLQQVPYVKEDTDLTILIPLGSNDEVGAVRRLIVHYVNLCQSTAGDNRQTRFVVAVRGVDPFVIRLINDDIIKLGIRCKPAQTETMLLMLKQDSHPVLAAAVLDEAVDHFGQQMMYLLLSPHADIQREFLDRVRINTIKHFQVFFPLPFVEYHPRIVSANEALQSKMKVPNVEIAHEMGETDRKFRSPKTFVNGANTDIFMSKFRDATFKRNIRPLIVHKDRGHFDPLDFSVFSLYGADFIRIRSRLNSKSLLLDLSSLFIGHQDIHMMRAVEPALRLRYHNRVCNPEFVDSDYARCLLSRREGLASKAQLANLLLSQKTKNVVAA
ncbi:chondroitin N-acetylgalactosaminyltransferase [Loa loa]|nr:chondroitin N-acetylgalactosaminyltransferase [Loa loa]EFO16227.1 chondroitin N-acetylgalactosaminyltransferase [Loa loa]